MDLEACLPVDMSSPEVMRSVRVLTGYVESHPTPYFSADQKRQSNESCRRCCRAFLTATACSTAPEIHYYTLSAESATKRIAVGAGPAGYVIDAIPIPDLLDRLQIASRARPNRVDVLHYDHWAEPLPDLLRLAPWHGVAIL